MSTIHDLYDNVLKKDSIGTHDWSDDTEWENYPEGGWIDPNDKDSSFTIQPEDGQAIVIPRARIRYSKNAAMHSPMIIEYYIGETKVAETVYKNQDDFFDRFDDFEVFETSNGTEMPADIWSHEYEFDEPLVLWSSSAANKINKAVIRIEDDEPYQDSESNPIGMARVRYLGCLICTDPDY